MFWEMFAAEASAAEAMPQENWKSLDPKKWKEGEEKYPNWLVHFSKGNPISFHLPSSSVQSSSSKEETGAIDPSLFFLQRKKEERKCDAFGILDLLFVESPSHLPDIGFFSWRCHFSLLLLLFFFPSCPRLFEQLRLPFLSPLASPLITQRTDRPRLNLIFDVETLECPMRQCPAQKNGGGKWGDGGC